VAETLAVALAAREVRGVGSETEIAGGGGGVVVEELLHPTSAAIVLTLIRRRIDLRSVIGCLRSVLPAMKKREAHRLHGGTLGNSLGESWKYCTPRRK
jgi:hypothetical protein